MMTSIRFPFLATRVCPCPECGISVKAPHLKVNTTVCCPKFASNSVLMWISGGLDVAFWITKNNFVTISITCPVWNTKSPFFLPNSDWKLREKKDFVKFCSIKMYNASLNIYFILLCTWNKQPEGVSEVVDSFEDILSYIHTIYKIRY